MTTQIRRSITTFCILLICSPGAASGQTSESAKIRAASPEVFQAIKQFYEYNRDVPLNAKSLRKETFSSYTREKLVFTGVQNSRVPAYLALPKTGTGPFPVVILIDGIYGSKSRWFEEDSWPRGALVTNALTASGIAVLALDARYHGERAAENDYQIPEDPSEQRDMIVQSVIEHRRAMDYLATRSDIDSNRIGLLGLSLGGIMTFVLSSIDPRVKAAVAGVTPVGALKSPGSIPIAPQTFAGAIPDLPFLMLMTRKDRFYTADEAQQLFDSLKGQRKELVFYDSDHRPPAEYAGKAVEWLSKYLK
jgi:dienelactone hydrolase